MNIVMAVNKSWQTNFIHTTNRNKMCCKAKLHDIYIYIYIYIRVCVSIHAYHVYLNLVLFGPNELKE